MAEEEKMEAKTVPALQILKCPWRKWAFVELDKCVSCEHHKQVKRIVEHRFDRKLERTEPHLVGLNVVCGYPMALQVTAVELVEREEAIRVDE
jgi:hypothetical protein